MAEDCLARVDVVRALHHLTKARLDKNNIEADLLMAANFTFTKQQGLKDMEVAEKK
ncbi:hypothetical protein FRB95_014512, partial [Tulasnella sp. JGI-2019a]